MITAAEIRAQATDTISQWLPGYTEPEKNSTEPQRRIVTETVSEGFLIIRVEGERSSGEPDKRFRLILIAEEL